MKAVILAAGKGMRLGHSDLPKPLTSLATGESIFGRQLRLLQRFLPIGKIEAVVGYHSDAFIEAFSQIRYISNRRFEETNTSKSLLLALEHCEEDVLWLNGDVVFHPAVLDILLMKPKTSMVVNVGVVGEEEVKYRQDGAGRILEVSKQVKGPQGEALGINYWSAADVELLRSALLACSDRDYFERAIESCIEKGMEVRAVPVDADLCTEVDFPDDLERANALLQAWGEDTEND